MLANNWLQREGFLSDERPLNRQKCSRVSTVGLGLEQCGFHVLVLSGDLPHTASLSPGESRKLTQSLHLPRLAFTARRLLPHIKVASFLWDTFQAACALLVSS